MLIPSSYLAYALLQERKFSQNVNTFIENELTRNGYTLIYERTQFNSRPKKIELAFLDKRFSRDELKELNDKKEVYQLGNTELIIRQDSTDLKADILAELSKNSAYIDEKDITIQNLRKELSSYKIDNEGLLKEIDLLFPELKPYSLGKQSVYVNQDSSKFEYYLIHSTDLDDKRKVSLENWLKQKLNSDSITFLKNK